MKTSEIYTLHPLKRISSHRDALNELLQFFKTFHFSSFGFSSEEVDAVISASAILKYAKITQKTFLPFISSLKPYRRRHIYET
ncbi:MAG: hypothetical protein Q9M89_03760 [Persephonella sp.]|nr:hypothetical protein [Persephonella sp.]